jgi:hypothetical protein
LEKLKERAFIRSLFNSHPNKTLLTRTCFKNLNKIIKLTIKKSWKVIKSMLNVVMFCNHRPYTRFSSVKKMEFSKFRDQISRIAVHKKEVLCKEATWISNRSCPKESRDTNWSRSSRNHDAKSLFIASTLLIVRRFKTLWTNPAA